MIKRDDSLDILKGVACILMVFSHASIDTRNIAILSLGFMGSFAAVLFFSVTGVTAWMQAGRRLPKEVLPPYLILLLAGFSLNGIIHIDFYKNFEVEMLQMIAMGASLVFLAQHFLHPRPVHYFLAGILIYILKLSLDLLAQAPISAQVLARPWLQGVLLPPGTFTPIPWLFVFFLGVFAYQASARKNLFLSSIAVFTTLGIFLVTRNPALLDLVNKWDMSIGYFLFSCFCLFFSYYLTKRMVFNKENPISRYILFLGRNSLLFLYFHIFVINILSKLGAAKLVWLYWPLVLMITSVLLYIIVLVYPKLNLSKLFHYKVTWLILITCVMITPLAFKNKFTIFLLELFWGVCLSTNYAISKELFRVKQVAPIGNPEKIAGG